MATQSPRRSETSSNPSSTAQVKDIEKSRTKCRGMKWWQTAILITAATCSLGVLSLPSAIASVGIIPGSLLILFLGTLEWYTGYLIYLAARRHPYANSFPALMGTYLGPWGFWSGAVILVIVCNFTTAAHQVGLSHVMQAISSGYFCTIWSTVIGAVFMGAFTINRGMKETWWLSTIACFSLVLALIFALVSVVIDRPHEHLGYAVAPMTASTFPAAMQTTSNILFVFMAHIAYPTIISQMEDPEEFPKALKVQFGVTTTLCVIVAAVFYAIVGPEVESPLLGSTTGSLKMGANVAAFPNISVAGVVACAVEAQFLYTTVWDLCGQPDVTGENSFRAWASWIAIICCCWGVSSVIALALPIFHQIIGLVGAAFGPVLCLGLPALFELRRQAHFAGSMVPAFHQAKWTCMLQVSIIVLGSALLVFGLYGNIVAINDVLVDNFHPFSCAFRKTT